jgi:AraC-like DNA-binding protein
MMNTQRQFETLLIKDFEEEVFHLPPHGHTYYEMIYIYKGSGLHYINKNCFPYKAGDLFLLSPDDEHDYDIKKSTRFILIKFTDSYFNNNNQSGTEDFARVIPEAIMRQKLLKEVKLKLDEPYKTILHGTIKNILAYNCDRTAAHSPLIYHQILSIFGLIKEAVQQLDDRIDNGEPDKEALLSYIHHHIYEPKRFQVKHIASHFNISVNYFSAYFKRNFDISYRDYINQYRTKLIEQRINAGQVNMKQIAAEFGFTDESHLSNYFKTHHESRPTAYRKKQLSLT